MLESDRFADEVREDEQTAARFGINGVPFFVLDRRLGVSGAQSVEVMLGALEQAAGDSHLLPDPRRRSDGGACAGSRSAARHVFPA